MIAMIAGLPEGAARFFSSHSLNRFQAGARRGDTMNHNKSIVNVKVGIFDRYVLKPLWVIYIVLCLMYFIKGAWLIGGSLIVMLYFIGVIGAALHPNMTTAEMMHGTTPSKEDINNDPNHDNITDIEAILMSRAIHKIALLNGITAIVISWVMQWYYIALIGVGTFISSLIIIIPYSAYMIGRKMINYQ